MKGHIAVVVLVVINFPSANALAEVICATKQCANAHKVSNLPSDVLSFVNRRDGCDHFRGEPTDFNEAYLKQTGEAGLREQRERAEFVNQRIAELCIGTDAQLFALKARYAANPAVLTVLNTYEQKIEAGR